VLAYPKAYCAAIILLLLILLLLLLFSLFVKLLEDKLPGTGRGRLRVSLSSYPVPLVITRFKFPHVVV
jgi:hypothetical protein